MTVLKNTWHHIRRSPYQSFTAILMMIVCFFTLSTFLITSNGLSNVLKYFETKPEITIFLKDGIENNTADNIQKELSSYPNIKEIRYISKEKALTIYKEQNKENPMLTEMVTSSILPASIEITVSDPKVLEVIYQNYTSKTEIVDEIIYQKDIVQSLLDWTNATRKVGIAITSVIGIISFFTVFIIVGMKITNRKEEIRVSRLLGASQFYVQKPFLLEGLFYGLFGGLIGSITSFLIAHFLKLQINDFFQPVMFIDNNYMIYVQIILIIILSSSTLGLIASLIGTKRYIKF